MLDRPVSSAGLGRRVPSAVVLIAAVLSLASPLVAQDVWPDSAFLSQFRWRSVGPANISGRVTDVEGIPGTPVFYVATAAGGIWKSTNSGTTYRPLFQDERVVAMGDIAIAMADTSIVWAGTGEEDSRNSISPGGGVYKSTDGGLTWTLMGLEETQVIGRIVIHPENPDLVYVAALGHIWDANEERGVYRTKDGGETWERILHVSEKAGFVDLVMHPTDPNILFASSWERVRGPYFLHSGGPGSALWTSTDGGDSWTEVSGGGFPQTEKGRIGIAIAHSNPDVMYTIVEAAAPEEADTDGDGEDDLHGSGLYRSEDGGQTWAWMNDQNTRPFYYSQVRVDPSDSDHVVWSSTPVRFSKDGGATVGQTTRGVHVDHHALWWDISNPDHYIVGNDGGIAITRDRGGNWDFPNTFAIGQFYAVSYNMDVPYRVCGGLQDNGTWCGPSRRRQGSISNHMWHTVNSGDGFWAPQDLQDPDILWAESQGGSMARINVENGARQGLTKPTWKTATKEQRDELVTIEDEAGGSPTAAQTARVAELREQVSADSAAVQLRWNWNTPMVVSVHDPDVLYAAANSVLKSTERGDDLKVISPDLTYADTMKIRVSTTTTGGITPDVTGAETFATIVAFVESPLRQGLLYAGTDDGRLWMTANDGETWTELTDRIDGVPDGTYVSRVEASHHDADRMYVTFDGHRTNDFEPYVFVTDDGGVTFRSISNDLPRGKPDFLHVVREDPVNENLLFVGSDVGVYMSANRGASWQKFMNGLPTTPVHDLKIHPRDRELIAGTHGRSIWIVDIGPLAQVADAPLADEVVLFDPVPALQYGDRMIGGEAVAQRVFQGESRRYGAQIFYYIPRDVSSTVMSAAREAREAAAEASEAAADAPEAAADAPAVRSPGPGSGRAQSVVTIFDAAGDTVQVMTGAVTPGLKSVFWNFQPRRVPEPLSPSERRDSVDNVRIVREVADSLLAEGADSTQVERAVKNFTNRQRRGARPGFGGGATSAPQKFQERPGENAPRARPGGGRAGQSGGSGFASVNRDFFRALRARGVGFGGFGGAGGGALADPGDYTVELRLGDQTFTTRLEVIRKEGYDPEP
ncbi:MAG: WD40/YVTN/BNR-like repeat-containing protein [Gemmatimonadota bacterium]